MSVEKKKKKLGILESIVTALGLVMCLILVPILLVNCILIVKGTVAKDKVPTAFGMFPMVVLTNSMDPVIKSGDLVICRTVSPEAIREGDIICFYSNPALNVQTVTHRVVRSETAEDGGLRFITKGDANNAEDNMPVQQQNVVGKYVFCIPGMGNTAMFMQTNKGVLCCVVLPLILLVVFEMIGRAKEEARRQKEADTMQIQMDILRSRKQVEERLKSNRGENSQQ